ncbi:wall-associated receptor kinase 3-like protein [Carex littledalei]|uniref:Wall-associated receptor kinase 3-like protein n=1 Tax=Carex littledalei TaxID=544730 RepID=A0A833R5B0_9POAL|nr:wall-associated receptor kinase 3-like protein [Carex littledalei]
MHPLWLSIFLSLLICFTSVSMPLNPVAHDGSATDNTSDCYSVPYPFRVPGVAFKGFEVICRSTTTGNRTKSYMSFLNSTKLQNPSLKLPTGTYLIQNISLQGHVRILTGPIYQQCNDSGTEALTRGAGWLNLTGTPFTLSTNDTTFVAIGCDDVVMIKGFVGDDNGGGRNFTSACVSICSNPSSTTDGYSSGLGCCPMPLPGPRGLKSIELNL